MGKINVITPIHIATGNDYFTFTIYDKKRYPLEAMLDTVENKEELIKSNGLNKLLNKNSVSQMSNDEFFRIFQVQSSKVDPSKALYSIDYYRYRTGKVAECEKTCNNLYIPGSTIKGYIINVAWYDMINKDQEIERYLSNNIKFLNKIATRVSQIQQVLVCRDIVLEDEKPYLYNCNRFGYNQRDNRETNMPVAIIETINKDVSKDEVEIYIEHNREMINQYKVIKNSILSSIDRDRNSRDRRIEKKMVESLYKRLINLSSWFNKANEHFVSLNIDEELDFIDYTRNKSFDKNTLRDFYNNLKNKLSQGKIIIRIGKYTNYYFKTISSAFDNFYDRFSEVYSPSKRKSKPEIESMNILEGQSGRFDMVPGYLEIEL